MAEVPQQVDSPWAGARRLCQQALGVEDFPSTYPLIPIWMPVAFDSCTADMRLVPPIFSNVNKIMIFWQLQSPPVCCLCCIDWCKGISAELRHVVFLEEHPLIPLRYFPGISLLASVTTGTLPHLQRISSMVQCD